MNLYFTDSNDQKTLIAEDISVTEAPQKILDHQKSRFIHLSGKMKVEQTPNLFTFKDGNGANIGYTLEK